MRRVRIVISGMGTAMPTLVAFVVPAIDACGSGGEIIDARLGRHGPRREEGLAGRVRVPGDFAARRPE